MQNQWPASQCHYFNEGQGKQQPSVGFPTRLGIFMTCEAVGMQHLLHNSPGRYGVYAAMHGNEYR